jgi:hypothetical protein
VNRAFSLKTPREPSVILTSVESLARRWITSSSCTCQGQVAVRERDHRHVKATRAIEGGSSCSRLTTLDLQARKKTTSNLSYPPTRQPCFHWRQNTSLQVDPVAGPDSQTPPVNPPRMAAETTAPPPSSSLPPPAAAAAPRHPVRVVDRCLGDRIQNSEF